LLCFKKKHWNCGGVKTNSRRTGPVNMSTIYEQVKSVIDASICKNEAVFNRYLERIERGKFSRDENGESHFCVYFLPYNSATNKIFIVDHKKSGLWLAPGGHIDKNETLLQTLNREINEELGVMNKIQDSVRPFLLTITLIDRPPHPCREHLCIWFRFESDGLDFKIDLSEFYETKWVTIEEARKIVTDPATIEGLDKMEQFFNGK